MPERLAFVDICTMAPESVLEVTTTLETYIIRRTRHGKDGQHVHVAITTGDETEEYLFMDTLLVVGSSFTCMQDTDEGLETFVSPTTIDSLWWIE